MTQRVRIVARNTSLLVVGHLIGSLVNIAAGLLLARHVGASDYGVYNWALAYLAFFTILTDLGMGSIIVRDMAKDPSDASTLLGSAVSLRLGLSLLATALACLVVSLLDQPFSTKAVVYIASLSLSITALGPYGLFSAIFQVKLRMEYAVAVRILTGLATLGSYFVLVQMTANLAHFVWATVSCQLLGLCIIWYLSKRFVETRLALDVQVWKTLLKESWPLALNTVFTTTCARTGHLMLLQMKGPEAVGYYSAALRLVDLLTPFVVAFMTSAFPLMAKYFRTSEYALLTTYRLSFKYLLMAIIPIAAALTLLSEPIVLLTYGEGFVASAPLLSILIWSEVFVFYGIVHYYLLIAVGKQRTFLVFTGVAATTNIILNLLLIPAYGAFGASIAAVISNIFGAGLIMGHLLPSTRTYNMLGSRFMIKPFLASLVMSLYMHLARGNLVLAIVGGIVVFAVVMFFIGGIGIEDVRLAKAMLPWE